MTVRIGMIGVGTIAKFYVAAFQQVTGAKLVAVCDLQAQRVAPFAVDHIDTTQDYRELLKRDDIDAVVVNVPNDQHYAICRDALAAGKHICCEKPLTTELAEAEQLGAQSYDRGRVLFTAFHRRYNKNLISMLPRLVQRSQIAHVIARYWEKIEEHAGDDSWYLDPRRCGGGCIADNGPNVFDSLTCFLGPLEVRSASARCDEHGIDREAVIELVSSEGISARVHLDWAYPRGERKDIEVRFHGGERLVIDMLAGFVGFKASLWHEYEAILRDFLVAIARGGCHGQDGIAAVRLQRDTYRALGVQSRPAGLSVERAS